MVNYECPRCGYSNNIKTKYVNHLRRKKLCEAKISNNNLDAEYIKFNIYEKLRHICNYYIDDHYWYLDYQ